MFWEHYGYILTAYTLSLLFSYFHIDMCNTTIYGYNMHNKNPQYAQPFCSEWLWPVVFLHLCKSGGWIKNKNKFSLLNWPMLPSRRKETTPNSIKVSMIFLFIAPLMMVIIIMYLKIKTNGLQSEAVKSDDGASRCVHSILFVPTSSVAGKAQHWPNKSLGYAVNRFVGQVCFSAM